MAAKRQGVVKSVLLGAAMGAMLVAGGPSARAQDYVKAGVLTCTVGGGIGLIFASNKRLDCTFQPDVGGSENYTGRIRKFGIDVGVTRGAVIVWAVLSSVQGLQEGALGGSYGGVAAEASVVLGAGANALLGGSNRSIALQPLSVQGQVGLNIAAGIAALDLYHVP